jgi:hypothetical protein
VRDPTTTMDSSALDAVFWAKTPLEKLSNRPVPTSPDIETDDGEKKGFAKGSFATDRFDSDRACIVNNPQTVRKSKAESITTKNKVNDSDSYLFCGARSNRPFPYCC